jgi:hypothetical protein
LAGNQLHQQGQAEEAPPRLAEGNQAQDGPVMPSDMFAPVGIAAVVFPKLDAGHLAAVFGDQQGVYDRQVGTVDLQAVAQFGAQRLHERLADRRGVPAVFRQEAFPTGQVAVNPEASLSHAAHRFPTTRQQQAQDVAAEEDKTGLVKVRLKEQQIVEEECWDEGCHRVPPWKDCLYLYRKRRLMATSKNCKSIVPNDL